MHITLKSNRIRSIISTFLGKYLSEPVGTLCQNRRVQITASDNVYPAAARRFSSAMAHLCHKQHEVLRPTEGATA